MQGRVPVPEPGAGGVRVEGGVQPLLPAQAAVHLCRPLGGGFTVLPPAAGWGGPWPRGQTGRPAQGPGHGPAGEGEEGEGGPLAASHQGPQGPPEGPVPGHLILFPLLIYKACGLYNHSNMLARVVNM